MAEPFSRRYALLGWVVGRMARRRMRKKLRREGDAPHRRKFLRGIVAVAALAAIARAAAKRAGGGDGDGADVSGDDRA